MYIFIESIDRIIPSCTFCFTDEITSLLKKEFMCKSKFTYSEKIFYLPKHYRILPLRENTKQDFWEFFDNKYEYLLINLLNRDLFCIDNNLKSYIQLFNTPLNHKEISVINRTGVYKDYFINLLEERIILKFDPNESESTQLNTYKLEIYNQLGYKIISLLNKSEFSYTYLVQKDNEKKYVLKNLLKSNDISPQKALLNEISIREKLGNPNYFARLIHYDIDSLFYIIEYIHGNDLVFYLKDISCLNERIRIMKCITFIVSCLHNSNIIHGDLHLEQFRVTNNNTIKLLDLELAMDLDSNNNIDLDFAGGSFEYLEPEAIILNPFKLLKTNNRNKKAEIYRLGVLLYSILYDEFPHMELTWKQLFESKITDNPTFNKETRNKETIPTSIITALKQCLKRDPKKRFSSAQEVYDMIK